MLDTSTDITGRDWYRLLWIVIYYQLYPSWKAKKHPSIDLFSLYIAFNVNLLSLQDCNNYNS